MILYVIHLLVFVYWLIGKLLIWDHFRVESTGPVHGLESMSPVHEFSPGFPLYRICLTILFVITVVCVCTLVKHTSKMNWSFIISHLKMFTLTNLIASWCWIIRENKKKKITLLYLLWFSIPANISQNDSTVIIIMSSRLFTYINKTCLIINNQSQK